MTKETESESKSKPVWSERLGGGLSPLMDSFASSIGFDIRMWRQDIRASQAYARALKDAGVITGEELESIVSGLDRVREEFENGKFEVKAGDEDIHMAVERRLTELIGPVAGKLHTGRSRNDQVATDLRLWLADASAEIDGALTDLGLALTEVAERHLDLIMPGYTHLQHSTPITFGHLLMAHLWPIVRDRDRLRDCVKRSRQLPLGSGALAGTSYPVDREKLARELGFDRPTNNSIDAVSDRDFCLEFMAAGAISMTHLSRLAEDLIILATAEFGLVRIAPEFSTGSSLLPQKRNPDSLELIRAKSGRVTGDLLTLLTVLKGLPSAYNKDLQEDKEALFDAQATWRDSLKVAAGVVETLEVDPETVSGRIRPTVMSADLADYLVTRGVPFREAYRIVCRLVRDTEEGNQPLDKIELEELKTYHEAFDSDVTEVFDPVKAVERRRVTGGTAPERVREEIELGRRMLSQSK